MMLIMKFCICQHFYDRFIENNSYITMRTFITLDCLNIFPLFLVMF